MKPTITFTDFQKLELRVGTILSVEAVSGSDKMLKFQVDLGEEKRQILAGMGKYYTPETLSGKQVVVLINLEAKKMLGEMSEAMLLAADEEGKPTLISPEAQVPAGTLVR